MKSLDRPTLVDLELGNDWEITYNQLYNLDPTETGLYENNRFSVWAYFSEDLLQVKNERQGILLDVGWYPDGDELGQYRLVVVNREGKGYDWLSPLDKYQTRYLADLLKKIKVKTSELDS